MTKDELEIKISTLQNLVLQKNEELSDYAAQIERLNDELKDLNKPKLEPAQFDELHTAIEMAVGSFDFNDSDNYDTDFHIDYNNRIAIESMSFQIIPPQPANRCVPESLPPAQPNLLPNRPAPP